MRVFFVVVPLLIFTFLVIIAIISCRRRRDLQTMANSQLTFTNAAFSPDHVHTGPVTITNSNFTLPKQMINEDLNTTLPNYRTVQSNIIFT